MDDSALKEFLQTCSGIELAVMQRDARKVDDDLTLNAVLLELRRRANQEFKKD